MAYGRLDVYWPDGKFETFSLEDNSISVGRSSGNTIALDTDTISRYHVSITLEDQRVFITDMDSANGTYVDGLRITSNEPRELRGGEEVQIGHLRMIYHAIEDIPTLPMSPIQEDTNKITKEAVPFTMQVRDPPIAIPPGSHTSTEIKLTNTSDETQVYNVELESVHPEWFRVNRPQLEVDAGQTASILLSVKPVRRSESTPGIYTITIKISHLDDADAMLTAEVNTTILGFTGFGVALASQRLSPNEPFRLHMHNQSSVPMPVTVSARSKDNALRFGITAPQITLGPGQRQVIQGEIKPVSRNYIGGDRVHPFTLLVRSRDNAGFLMPVGATYTERALFPAWAALTILAAGLGIIVLLILAVVLVVNAPDPNPEITAFNVQSTTVMQGDLITLDWDVTDADSLVISVDGEPILDDISPEPSTVNLTSDEYEGAVVIGLEAINGDNSDEQTVAITVERPLTVEYFEVLPTVLVRHTVETMSLRWRVRGATNTRVDGLIGFSTTTTVDPSYGAEGEVTVPGIAEDNFTITLIGTDVAGNTVESVVNIDVIVPECTPDTELILFASPDGSSNVVSTVQQDIRLVVDGRDDSGAWLRVQLPGGVNGWGARDILTCADFFSVDNLRIIEFTLVPEATPDVVPASDDGG